MCSATDAGMKEKDRKMLVDEAERMTK